ncbi:MAG: response regulator [Myxococcota bacterium]
MKLEGMVEDVHLDEVLRVLAVSGRSGTLRLEGDGEGGFLSLSGGRILAARVDSDRRTVAEVLVGADLVPQETLDELSESQRKQPIPQCFSDLLTVMPELPDEVRAILQERLKDLTLKLLAIRAGRFHFTVSPEPPQVPCYLGDQGVAVDEGVPADGLVTEAKKRRTAPVEQTPAPRAKTGRLPAVPGVDLVLVDNDATLLAEARRRFSGRGLSTLTVEGVAQALQAMDEGTRWRPHTVAVVDLVMPRGDGRGILGGLDLIRRVKAKDPDTRVVLASDVDNTDAEQRAREMGVTAFVRKPPVGAGRTPDAMLAFLDGVLAAAGLADRAGSVDLAAELLKELGDAGEWRPESKVPASEMHRNLELVRALIAPLNDPELRDEIPLMILRVASSTFGRAALFLVTDQEFIGLGGFGLDANGRDPGRTLRDTHIPLDADSVLTIPLRERRASRQAFFESEWNRYLSERLGGPTPTDVFVAPILSTRQVEAVLYCDNAVDRRPLGDTQVLEIFLTQAGAAMERAALERRLLGAVQQTEGGVVA